MDATMDPHVLGEFTWSISDLAVSYPPRWAHENKQVVANVAGNDNATPGSITASRWALSPAASVSNVTVKECHHIRSEEGHFSYAPPPAGDPTTHWYMNFADPILLGYGEGALLAQDELQIAEHPILCSLAKAIEDGKHGQAELIRRTTDESTRSATPVLIQGAPRRCQIDGLYGDAFAVASKRHVQAAVTPINPPTASNILAISAMPPMAGLYIQQHIQFIFETAYAGFRATVLRSGRVTLHTGHWGCGAFGGNKGLVAAIQILAAGTAGVEQLIYWYGFTAQDRTAVEHGFQVAAMLHGKTWEEALWLLEAAGYRWGDANENHVPYQPPDNDLLQLPRSDEL
jgi:hypothetical protein